MQSLHLNDVIVTQSNEMSVAMTSLEAIFAGGACEDQMQADFICRSHNLGHDHDYDHDHDRVDDLGPWLGVTTLGQTSSSRNLSHDFGWPLSRP